MTMIEVPEPVQTWLQKGNPVNNLSWHTYQYPPGSFIGSAECSTFQLEDNYAHTVTGVTLPTSAEVPKPISLSAKQGTLCSAGRCGMLRTIGFGSKTTYACYLPCRLSDASVKFTESILERDPYLIYEGPQGQVVALATLVALGSERGVVASCDVTGHSAVITSDTHPSHVKDASKR